jgi:outer membrane protein
MRQATRIGGVVLTLLASAAISGGKAQAQVVKLPELEANALRARGSFATDDARLAQARARIDVARSAYKPSFNVLGDASASPGSRLVKFPNPDTGPYLVGAANPFGNRSAFVPFPRFSAMLEGHGTLYDFGRTAASVEAAQAQRRAAEADADKTRHDVRRDVRLAYVHWASAQALWSLARESAAEAERRSAQTGASIEEGARPTADRIATETDAAFSQLELDRASATLESARVDLGYMAVVELAPNAEPDPSVLDGGLFDPSGTSDDAPLRALEQQRLAARSTAKIYDHAFAPTISAQVQAGVQGQDIDLFPLYRVGLNVTVPLWNGGADTANRSQAEAHAAELEAQAGEYRRQREYERKRAQLVKAQAERRLGLANRLIELCNTRLGQLEEGYPLGAATLPQVADARAAVQRARTELVLAQAMRAEALLDVY